jgi:hypothetical protein
MMVWKMVPYDDVITDESPYDVIALDINLYDYNSRTLVFFFIKFGMDMPLQAISKSQCTVSFLGNTNLTVAHACEVERCPFVMT